MWPCAMAPLVFLFIEDTMPMLSARTDVIACARAVALGLDRAEPRAQTNRDVLAHMKGHHAHVQRNLLWQEVGQATRAPLACC